MSDKIYVGHGVEKFDGDLVSISVCLTDLPKEHMFEYEGKKYIKITKTLGPNQRSVWGFIVKEDGPKFRKGDILKAASWQAPALNSPRGNILDGGYTIKWTGPLYLN